MRPGPRSFRSAPVLLLAMLLMSVPALAQPTVAEAEARVADPFFTRTTFSIGKTLYVAANEPGASNSNNGKYLTWRGGKNGPFKDLTSTTLRQALINTSSGLRVYIRRGTYLAPDGGLRIRGLGTEATPVIVSGFPGDPRPIIDGGECLPWPTIRAIAAGAPYAPRVESTVKLDGRYDIIENVQIQCGFLYNVFARGQHTIVRRTIIRGGYEDAIKNAVGGDYGLVADNDISGFVSQGVDHFAANHWLITRNVFHHPGVDPVSGGVVGNAVTVKGHGRNVVITGNTVHGFLTAVDQAAITLGAPAGVAYLQYDSDGNVLPAAMEAIAMANTVQDFTGAGFSLQACASCVVAENVIERTIGMVRIGIDADIRSIAEDSGVLPYSSDLTVVANRAAYDPVDCSEPVYLGESCYAVYIVNWMEAQSLMLDGNAYYSDTSPVFATSQAVFDLPGFQRQTGTEATSLIMPLALWAQQ